MERSTATPPVIKNPWNDTMDNVLSAEVKKQGRSTVQWKPIAQAVNKVKPSNRQEVTTMACRRRWARLEKGVKRGWSEKETTWLTESVKSCASRSDAVERFVEVTVRRTGEAPRLTRDKSSTRYKRSEPRNS